jgi:hypothetical protein
LPGPNDGHDVTIRHVVIERPTSRPPFDPAQFAQEAESRLEGNESSSRRTTPPAFPRPSISVTPRALGETGLSASDPQGSETLAAAAVPILAMSRQELEWFALSPAASRLIGQVDGISPVDTVCTRAELPSNEGTMILLELSDQGIVTFR